jgi:hypothetical protein
MSQRKDASGAIQVHFTSYRVERVHYTSNSFEWTRKKNRRANKAFKLANRVGFVEMMSLVEEIASCFQSM